MSEAREFWKACYATTLAANANPDRALEAADRSVKHLEVRAPRHDYQSASEARVEALHTNVDDARRLLLKAMELRKSAGLEVADLLEIYTKLGSL